MQQHECPICAGNTAPGRTLCHDCEREVADALQWLRRIGMPTLRQVAYREVSFSEPSPRHGNRGVAPSPVNERAQALYADCERDLQLIAGGLGVRPVGCDRWGRARTLLDAPRLLAILLMYANQVTNANTIVHDYAILMGMRDRVGQAIRPPEERMRVGVCPHCLETSRTVTDPETGQTREEPVRTDVFAVRGQTTAICPVCGATLDLSDVRVLYLRSAGLMHITRTQSDAARWISDSTGVHVTGRELKDWRRRGKMPNTRHIEGKYWQWSVIDLLRCAEAKRTRDDGR